MEFIGKIYLILVIVFIAITFFIFGLGKLYNEYQNRKKLKQIASAKKPVRHNKVKTLSPQKIQNLLGPLYQLSIPKEGWQQSELKLKFIRAGIRNDSAIIIYHASKTVFFFLLPILALWPIISALQSSGVVKAAFIFLFLAGIGYYLPDLFINYRLKSRYQQMLDNLADFIDLLVICTESGLSLDAAINRVSMEMRRGAPVLSEEFYIACLEIRAGVGRIEALKNLALRANLEDLHSLVAMLVQADKFGTSLVNSLKIQSEFMRVKRLQRAEEMAAKVPLKMLFPLIFLIFPTLMIVLLGPAVIQIFSGLSGQL